MVPLNNVAPMSNCPCVQGSLISPLPSCVCVGGGGGGGNSYSMILSLFFSFINIHEYANEIISYITIV